MAIMELTANETAAKDNASSQSVAQPRGAEVGVSIRVIGLARRDRDSMTATGATANQSN